MSNLAFDVVCSKNAGYMDDYHIEVTENYENCKYYISVFDSAGESVNVFYAKTQQDFFDSLKSLKE
tara:strand:+ start:420 stop:617 length:198 start_codon:yes stop_codon:yes gene_type:complete